MPAKRKKGQPSVYNFKGIKPGKYRLFKVENIKSCTRCAQLYAQRHSLSYRTEKVTEGLRVWNMEDMEE